MLYWVLKYIVLGPWLKLIWRPTVEGLEHIPDEGPAIIASNHLSFSDSVFLPLVLKRKIVFIGKQEYFIGRGLKGWFIRAFFEGVGTIPVDRTGGRAAQGALKTAKRVLGEGKLFGIYPEGTRSPDGRLYRGKTGVARLALETGVQVIPVLMMNTDKVQPIGKVLPNVLRVRIRIGRPLDFSRYAGMAGDRFIERSVTDEIMYEMMRISGREYIDQYAAKVKAALAKGKPVQPADQRETVAA